MQIRNLLVNRYLCFSSCAFYFRIKAQNNTQIGFLQKYIFEVAFRLMFLGRTGIWTGFCGGEDSGHHSPCLRQHTIQKHLKIVFLFLFLPLPSLLYSFFLIGPCGETLSFCHVLLRLTPTLRVCP